MAKVKFTIPVSNGLNYVVVNLPTALTIQSRKLHRSCLEYTINGGYLYDSNNSARVKFGAAPNTWPVRAAIRRARNAWLQSYRQLFRNNPSMKPKWHDFKMALTYNQHLESGNSSRHITYNVPENIFDANIDHNEQGITWSVFTTESGRPGEQPSSITPVMAELDKDEFTCHLLGDHMTTNEPAGVQFVSIGALESWVNSRPDLNPATTVSDSELDGIQNDPINLLFDDGDADDEKIENMYNAVQGDGDMEGDQFPPYHLTDPVKSVMEVASAGCNSSSPVSYFTGFNALLGQVFMKIHSTGSGAIDILFDVSEKGMTI